MDRRCLVLTGLRTTSLTYVAPKFYYGTNAHSWRSWSMPIYHLHLHNDVDVRDEEGKAFPDLEAVIHHAQREARFTLAETIKDEGRANLDHRIDIEDSSGRVLATVHFRDVVTIEG